jgi:hypothetical protein
VKHETTAAARTNAKILPQALGIPCGPPSRGTRLASFCRGISLLQKEAFMPIFRLPLSGNVTQSINPWNWVFNPTGGQFGLVDIALGQSSNPAVEEEVLSDVASYGKQLGRIEDALLLLIGRAEKSGDLSDEEKQAFGALKDMMAQIAAVKAKHGAAPVTATPSVPLSKSRRRR